MEQRRFVVVGAGVSGLAFANEVDDCLVLERESEAGGWCRTIKRDGFVWDYSGHFFHFRHPAIEAWLRARMPRDSVRTIAKKSRVVDVDGNEVDFPFQTHLHQLPKETFASCIADLHAATSTSHADPARAASFKSMLAAEFGDAICAQFLVPYNEKLYATDLDRLDPDAMGRFFPHASLDEILASLSGAPTARGYNDTFTYPVGGAALYIHALLHDLAPEDIALGEVVTSIDVDKHVVTTTRRALRYAHLITSAPLPSTLLATGVNHDAAAFTCNQVLVFNLGFDKKGRDDVHWLYFADPSLIFYRVGFYDNILGGDRMSLYVELGQPASVSVDVDATRERVLADLARAQIVDGHRLVAHHHVVMNPAYVHVTARSNAEAARTRALLGDMGVHSIGRYGAWTYCSIEDNIVEARALAAALTD
jgi:protoporphyrinogen oxidase